MGIGDGVNSGFSLDAYFVFVFVCVCSSQPVCRNLFSALIDMNSFF